MSFPKVLICGAIRTPMAEGMEEGYEKLDALLPTLE